MASFYVWVTFGLCLLKLCLTETQFNVSCRYRGVFHVEKNGRYSLTRTEAADLCRALNSTLSTLEQLEKAHELGFETCRYGFIVGHIAIPRINPYHLCAANHTGIYKLSANTTGRYDAYCYNATETRDKACEPIERIDTSFLNNQSEIVIDNEDGSRYNADGTRHSGDSSTSGVDDENVGSGSSHDTTPVDTSIKRSSPSYYGSVTPVSHLSDHSSGGGEKDFPVKNSDDEISPTSTDISLVTGFNDFAKEDDEWHRGSTTPGPHRVHLEKTTTQTWWNPFSNEWWWSNPREKTQEPTQTTRADVTSSGNGSDDEDSSEETTYPTVFPRWDISVAKKEYAPSTTPGPHRVHLEKTTTQTWWNPFSNEWWWSNPREKTQEPTQTTRADVTSSGNGSDDEDSSEETTYPTVFPRWDISVAKKEYAPSTTPGPHRVHLEKTTTQTWWNPFSNEWWWSNPREKTQEPTQTTRADVTSSGNGSDDEDSSEETTYPTVFPRWDISVAKKEYAPSTTDVTSSGNGSDDEDSSEETTYPTVFSRWDISVAKKEYAPSTTMDLQHGVLLEISTQDHWNPSYTDEEEQYPSSAGRALVTSENEKRQGPTQHPLLHSAHSGWISQAQNPANTTGSTEHQEFTLPGENDIEKKTSYTAMASSHGARQNDSAQDPLVYPGWDKGEDYSTQAPVMDRVIPSRESNHEKESSNTALATPDGARHEDSTQPPLSSGNEAGWGTEGITHPTDAPGGEVLHGLTPASTNEAGDDSLLMVTESADIVSREEATKEPLAPSTQPGSESEQANTTDGSYVNLVPGVFSDIDDRHNQLQTPLPPTLATPDGARHEDSTQPPLSSGNEAGWGTEGITHPTDAPGGEVLHGLTPASTNEAGDDSLLMGTTVTASIDVLEPEDVTQEVWAPRVIVTALATPDGARHEDSTQPPLSSGNEAGWGTEGITHPTDAPGGEVLHGLTPASTNEAGDDSLLMGTITESADIVSREEATKEPLAPSTQPGSESEQANTTDGSYVNLVPGVFSDIDDRHNQLQTPLPPRSTSIIGGDHGSRKGNVEPTSNPGENATTTITSQPRSAQVPEWLIIVAALLALALILAVCIAVSSRRRCGQKKKLVINNGKGAVEDRKTSELNGDASKSQEMVHLVHKEQSNDRTGASDEFLTIDETQNHQELDMKSGV
ncbi:CD44 antigen isoform X10 [Cygnus olor]|uniref:CD44 antigen isoform X10 n=1 Tax=Cygnus olor TaxID=8869 RepID=UPI001ADEBB43|nr:CD44 antigen isoform X10 [Cygnus olor]